MQATGKLKKIAGLPLSIVVAINSVLPSAVRSSMSYFSTRFRSLVVKSTTTVPGSGFDKPLLRRKGRVKNLREKNYAFACGSFRFESVKCWLRSSLSDKKGSAVS